MAANKGRDGDVADAAKDGRSKDKRRLLNE
jgi:hypothetical protein